MKSRYVSAVCAVFACFGLSLLSATWAAEPNQPAKTAISEEANAAVQQMGKTLAAADMSFKARTIRVYEDDKGQPLHIFHTTSVVMHRPDRLAIKVLTRGSKMYHNNLMQPSRTGGIGKSMLCL